MSTSPFTTTRISLPPVPSISATSKFAALTEEQQDVIANHKTRRLGWRILFPSDLKDGPDALRGLTLYCAKAVNHLLLPDEKVTDCITDVLTAFTGMSEQQAYAHELESNTLRYIANRVKSRCIDHIRHTQTFKGRAEYKAKSLTEYEPDESQEGAGTFTDKALAVSMTAVRAVEEVSQSVLGALLANKSRLVSELRCKNADKVWRISVAVLGSASCQRAFQSGTPRDLDSAVTQAIARTLNVEERTARDHKAAAYVAIERACQSGSHLWAQVRDALRTEAGSDTLATTHAINRGRTRITTKIVVSKTNAATKAKTHGLGV